MAAIRLDSFVLGLAGLGRVLMFLSLALPFSLADRLIAAARGVTAVADASALLALACFTGSLRALSLSAASAAYEAS